VNNSSAWPSMLPKVWPAVEALHANTVEMPIYWEQFEPQQGHLGLARSAAMNGDATKARQAYQDFLALWKDADADLRVLLEAKKEYEKLK
jgi:beta-galactosidase GanA